MNTEDIRKKSQVNRKKMMQNIIRSRIKLKLEEIKEYHEEMEYKFKIDKKKLLERYNKKMDGKKISQDMEYQINEYFSEENFKIEEIFLQNFRYSIVVAIYSMLETTLSSLCHYLHRSKKLLLKLDELKGDGIERSKLYLQKICLIHFPEDSHEWKEIQKFNSIRNCIVHTEGNVEEVKNPQKLKNIIKNTRGISLDRSIERFIRIKSSYILSIIACIEKFIEDIHEEAFKTP